MGYCGFMDGKYREIWRLVFEQVTLDTQHAAQEQNLDFSLLSLRPIDQDALDAQAQWPVVDDPDREIGWSWGDACRHYRRNHMARIELAIWNGDELCGLMLGKASEGRLVVKVNYLQGSTLPTHALRGWITDIATRCAELFARAIDADWVAIQEPAVGLIGDCN
jgi:hypothetical protein